MPVMDHWYTEEEVDVFKPLDLTLERSKASSPAGFPPVCPRPRGAGKEQTW